MNGKTELVLCRNIDSNGLIFAEITSNTLCFRHWPDEDEDEEKLHMLTRKVIKFVVNRLFFLKIISEEVKSQISTFITNNQAHALTCGAFTFNLELYREGSKNLFTFSISGLEPGNSWSIINKL
jgi:hypothetical protein